MSDLLKNIHKVELFISDYLYERLKDYGAIKWHKNRNHSFYIKFRDVRLGSIRIANHKGRERYHYTYEIFKTDKDIERKMEDIVQSVIEKSKSIKGFDPNQFMVFDRKTRLYKKVADYKEYKQSIFGK